MRLSQAGALEEWGRLPGGTWGSGEEVEARVGSFWTGRGAGVRCGDEAGSAQAADVGVRREAVRGFGSEQPDRRVL